jgi:hypothetical protein
VASFFCATAVWDIAITHHLLAGVVTMSMTQTEPRRVAARLFLSWAHRDFPLTRREL